MVQTDEEDKFLSVQGSRYHLKETKRQAVNAETAALNSTRYEVLASLVSFYFPLKTATDSGPVSVLLVWKLWGVPTKSCSTPHYCYRV